jgi:hypothetical protein
MIARIQAQKIKEMAKLFPVLALTGPRQSGKPTLLKACFPDYRYVSLENLQPTHDLRNTGNISSNQHMPLRRYKLFSFESSLFTNGHGSYSCSSLIFLTIFYLL